MTSLSASQQQAISAAIKHGKDGAKRALHPANPADAAVIAAFLELSGKTKKTHPGLYADIGKLAGGKPDGDNPSQVIEIVDAGRDVHGRATARVWHLDQQGGFMSSSLALVLCAKSGKPLALGYANRVGGGLAPAATRSASAQPATDAITTVGFYHSQATPDAAPQFGMVTRTQNVAGPMTALPNTIDAPVISVPNGTEIKIALARPSRPADVDYYYNQPNNETPPLLVPFAGTVNVQQPLANVGSNGQFTAGLSLSTSLWSKAGNSYSQHDSSQSITSQVTANAATNVVTWIYPYDTNNPGPSLKYAPLAASRDTTTAFFFAFTIPVTDPINPSVLFNVCSYSWPEMPSVNCQQIPNLQFWWHCLAAGTKVTLADGSSRAIEDVDSTTRVRTGNGAGTLGVEATTRGQHQAGGPGNPAAGVYRLATKKGRTLVLTGGHPVATEGGLVRACDLAAGAVVRTDDGTDEVAECKPAASDGMFCNLKLVDETDRARGLAGAVGTFIANGIVVGDFLSMEQLHYNTTHSLDYMRPRIPERYHTDYASTLMAIVRDNASYGVNY